MTSRTFRIFWITNGKSKQTTITTKKKPSLQSLNYLDYVKDFDPNAHVRVFKAAIRSNGEMKDAKIVNIFTSAFRNIISH